MMQNYYLQEKLAETHRQDLLREAEQRRMGTPFRQQSFRMIRRIAVKLGESLIRLGMNMKQLEASSEQLLQE
jgi:hypothetical protein